MVSRSGQPHRGGPPGPGGGADRSQSVGLSASSAARRSLLRLRGRWNSGIQSRSMFDSAPGARGRTYLLVREEDFVKNKLFPVLLSMIVLLIGLRPLRAQATAAIVGTVRDSSGAPAPGARVTVSNVQTGLAESR